MSSQPDDGSRDDDADWNTATGTGYSADKLYTRASDAKGVSFSTSLRWPPYLHAQVVKNAAKRKVTISDYMRNAIVHECKRDEARNPNDPVFRVPEDILFHDEMLQLEADILRWEHQTEEVDRVLKKLIRIGQYDVARKVIEDAVQRVSEDESGLSTLVYKFDEMLVNRRDELNGTERAQRIHDERMADYRQEQRERHAQGTD